VRGLSPIGQARLLCRDTMVELARMEIASAKRLIAATDDRPNRTAVRIFLRSL